MRHLIVLFLLLLTLSAQGQKQRKTESSAFQFDPPDAEIKATLLENPLFYDAGIAPVSNGTWVAWLEFVPKQGDQLWLGLRAGEKWISRRLVSHVPGDLANPTPTIDSKGRLWLSYEKAIATRWHVVVERIDEGARSAEANSIQFPGINHSLTALPEGKLLVAWQEDVKGKFRIRSQEIGLEKEGQKISTTALKEVATVHNAWHPSTAFVQGAPYIAWDAYNGKSYNVFVRQAASSALEVAATTSFEAHAQIASDQNDQVWIAWEEGGENWGKTYRARKPGTEKKKTFMDDMTGPLHRYRKLHFGKLNIPDRNIEEYSLPQPSFGTARARTNAPAGLAETGVFYERAQIAIDGLNRPWIVYRHAYAPFIGVLLESHKQENMRVYARCLLPDGWSKLFQLDLGQGDGMQRLAVAPLPDGIAIAYTTGRTDRRKLEPEQRGVALAEIRLDKSEKAQVPAARELRSRLYPSSSGVAKMKRASTAVGGREYQLFYGDLHRHTDISLCYSPVDGTIDDTYRYAIDAAAIDFLGITDHTHDLDMGNPLALIWHRSRKEVNRHALEKSFIPFYSYERSRGDTDHNVISLREDMLRPHTYPHAEFWKELDTNTFTIPHEPVNNVTWKYKDDTHRPLLEIYQGFRNAGSEEEAKQGLLRGHTFGFIASSDHLSTSSSYAGVWAEEPTRESIFRAMQARRTFGATARIRLKVTCGDHWMGERFKTEKVPPFLIEVRPTAPISEIMVYVDGTPVKHDLSEEKPGVYKYEPAADLKGPHMVYVRITQEDGNRAWSSPIWIEVVER